MQYLIELEERNPLRRLGPERLRRTYTIPTLNVDVVKQGTIYMVFLNRKDKEELGLDDFFTEGIRTCLSVADADWNALRMRLSDRLNEDKYESVSTDKGCEIIPPQTEITPCRTTPEEEKTFEGALVSVFQGLINPKQRQ